MPEVARQIAHQTRELGEETADRLHPRLGDHLLEFRSDQADALGAGADASLILAGEGFVQLIAAEHQLAGQGHEGVEQGDVQADGGLRRRYRRAALALWAGSGGAGADGAGGGAGAGPAVGAVGAVGTVAAGRAFAARCLRLGFAAGAAAGPPNGLDSPFLSIKHTRSGGTSTTCPIRSGSRTVAYSTSSISLLLGSSSSVPAESRSKTVSRIVPH